MNRNRRIIFLLAINLGIAFLSLYILDVLEVIDYRQILSRVPFLRETYAARIEDPYLLEKVELEKKWQILDERTRNFEEEKKKLEDEARQIALERENLEKEKNNVKSMIENFEKMKSDRESYEKRVDNIASQIESMRPESAVKILEKQDDMLIIDIFKRIDAHAQSAGRQSIVPYLLSLMDSEQAARIQRKMAE